LNFPASLTLLEPGLGYILTYFKAFEYSCYPFSICLATDVTMTSMTMQVGPCRGVPSPTVGENGLIQSQLSKTKSFKGFLKKLEEI